jgi:hypothetical protein
MMKRGCAKRTSDLRCSDSRAADGNISLGSARAGLMNVRQILACLPLLLAIILDGCVSPNEGIQTKATTFSEREIRSRVWKEAASETLQLLEWSEIEFQCHGKLLVAKYGNTNTGFVTCLDIYRINDLGEGPDGVVPTFGSVLLTPTLPPPGVIANRRSFGLIAHDSGREMVKTIQTEETSDDVIITITRETIPGLAKERMQVRYRLFYNERSGVTQDPSVGIWRVPE